MRRNHTGEGLRSGRAILPSLRAMLQGADPFPTLRDFYASRGHRRQVWIDSLDAFSTSALQALGALADCDTEGETDWLIDGLTDGDIDGEIDVEGLAEGLMDGETLGETEGLPDGLSETETEGEIDGLWEGEAEVEADGRVEDLEL